VTAMANRITQGFQEKLIELAVEELLPTKNISVSVKHGRKYAQVISSIREVGLIEAPVVTPFKKGKGYLLLDGHLRIMALKELGIEHVSCLISTDDEAYTYNKYINRLSAIQEHRMIVKALQSGVSEEKLASALNLDIVTIKNKRNLLEGICLEAADLLKDKAVSEHVFRALRKMQPPRQVNVALLMNDQNKFTANYAKALLEATPAHQLVNRGNQKKKNSAILARQARLEEESLALSGEIGSLKGQYGKAMLDMTSMQAYLKRLLGNEAVVKFLRDYNESIFDKFEEIIELDVIRFKNMER